MARSKKMVVSETTTDKNDAVAQVMSDGIDAIINHNKHLIQVDAHKDEMLLRVVEQAQQERIQFAKIHTTMVEKFSETIETIQKLKDREYEREEKRDEAKFIRDLKQRGYTDLRQLASIAVNQHFGRPMLKETERGVVTELVESINDEQLEKLQTIFTPAQMASFAKIYKAAQDVQESESTSPLNGDKPENDNARH